MEKKLYYIIINIDLKRQLPGKELDCRREVEEKVRTHLDKKGIPCNLLVVQPDQINLKVIVDDPHALVKELSKRILRYAGVSTSNVTEYGEEDVSSLVEQMLRIIK